MSRCASAEQRFRAALVEDGARVRVGHDFERDTRRQVDLYRTGDDVHGRTLRCEYEVYAGRTRFLRYYPYPVFHVFLARRHEVGQLVHYHHDVRELHRLALP